MRICSKQGQISCLCERVYKDSKKHFTKKIYSTYFVIVFLQVCLVSPVDSAPVYKWKKSIIKNALVNRIKTPKGFLRIKSNPESFEGFLRNLPLKSKNSRVRLYNGKLKDNQDAHYAVIDIDTGKRNLQQCADAIMRLRAEYLYSQKSYGSLHFNFTDGVPARFELWRKGYRPLISKSKTRWIKRKKPDSSYKSFRRYMQSVFIYAGTYSLQRESKKIDISSMKAGDFFIQGGFPGHAVIVVDVVKSPKNSQLKFLLAQSFMPAQDMHILKNPASSKSPWYSLPRGQLITPEWTFKKGSLYRFKN